MGKIDRLRSLKGDSHSLRFVPWSAHHHSVMLSDGASGGGEGLLYVETPVWTNDFAGSLSVPKMEY